MVVKLQVLISTFGERFRTITPDRLPRVDGVAYLICCQNPEGLELPPPIDRPDVATLFFQDSGISANRNHGIDNAVAPYVLFSDDDLDYDAPGLAEIIKAYERNPGMDWATFRVERPGKIVFPPAEHDLAVSVPGYCPCAVELSARRESLFRSGLRFNLLAGPGAPFLTVAEDDFFCLTARRMGLTGKFFPVTVARHPHPTTSDRCASHPGMLRAKGAVIRLTRGNFTALTRYPVEAIRAPLPFFKALRYLFEGFAYSIKHRKDL